MPATTTPAPADFVTCSDFSHSFASDNYSGIHPDILQAIAAANQGHAKAYGEDCATAALRSLVRQHFGDHASAYPVFNGTGANVLALAALTPRFGAVIAVKSAHIQNDESVAPEYVAGLKILTAESDNGKLSPESIKSFISSSQHRPTATTVYISQVSELGTCYSLQELAAIRRVCDEYNLRLYIDGARLCNAVAFLGCSLYDIAQYADILSLGGTKNGLLFGECLVVMNPDDSRGIAPLRKSSLQLASKMRFISAQFNAWLGSGLYLKLAQHSNAMADYLQQRLSALPGIRITYPVQSNAVFVALPSIAIARQIAEQFHCYIWHEASAQVRLMTGFDTQKSDIDALVDALAAQL